MSNFFLLIISVIFFLINGCNTETDSSADNGPTKTSPQAEVPVKNNMPKTQETSQQTSSKALKTPQQTTSRTPKTTKQPPGDQERYPKANLPAHIRAYLDKYVTDFSPSAASLDFVSNKPLVSDEGCVETFGENSETLTQLRFSERSDDAKFKEYLAGQVLAALGFPTARTCFYKDSDNKLQVLYRNVPRLSTTLENNLANDNGLDHAKGGTLVDKNIYWQTLPQFELFGLIKWLVAETDYNNLDYFAFALPSGYSSKFVFDFEHAGNEKRDLSTVASSQNIFSLIYDKSNKIKNKRLPDEAIYGFIHQMKQLIEDVSGEKSSVLARIFYNDRIKTASFAGTDALYTKIRQQIEDLIAYMENIHKADPKYAGFADREAVRMSIVDKLAAKVKVDKSLIRASLMGPFWLRKPSDINELKGLDANTDALAQKENDRLSALANYKISYAAAHTPHFTYAKSPDFYIIQSGEDLAGPDTGIEKPIVDYIKTHLNGLTLKGVISVRNNKNLESNIKEIIGAKAPAVIVGPRSQDLERFGIASDKKKIEAIYKNENALNLPKFVIHVERKIENDDTPTSYQSGFRKLYKSTNGQPLKIENISDDFIDIGASLSRKSLIDSGPWPIKETKYIDELLQFLKEKVQ